jgi:hypothetical protein
MHTRTSCSAAAQARYFQVGDRGCSRVVVECRTEMRGGSRHCPKQNFLSLLFGCRRRQPISDRFRGISDYCSPFAFVSLVCLLSHLCALSSGGGVGSSPLWRSAFCWLFGSPANAEMAWQGLSVSTGDALESLGLIHDRLNKGEYVHFWRSSFLKTFALLACYNACKRFLFRSVPESNYLLLGRSFAVLRVERAKSQQQRSLEDTFALDGDLLKNVTTSRDPVEAHGVKFYRKRAFDLPPDAPSSVYFWTLDEKLYLVEVIPRAPPQQPQLLLPEAVRQGRVEETRAMLLCDASLVNVKLHAWQWPIVTEAVKYKQYDVVELLLLFGANVNEPSVGGSHATPLHQAAFRGEERMILLLLSKGANLLARTKGGNLPVHNALLQPLFETVSLFLEEAKARHPYAPLQTWLEPPNRFCNTDLLRGLLLCPLRPRSPELSALDS